MLRPAIYFVVASVVGYLALASLFTVFCLVVGHNDLEMLYGASASVTLSIITGAIALWKSQL